jgi:hypothetical protein
MPPVLSLNEALEILAGHMILTAGLLRQVAAEAASRSDVEGVLADAQNALGAARRMLSDTAPPRS